MRRVVLLVVSGLALGALLTGAAGALPGSQDLTALTWLATVATVAALVVAVGIFRVQQAESDAAHQELLDALKAQDEILQDLSDAAPSDDGTEEAEEQDAPAPAEDDVLTPAQRAAIAARYGDRAIEAAFSPGGVRGDRARLVRLDDGTLLTVYTRGRDDDRIRMHEVSPRGVGRPGARQRRGRGSERG